MKIRTFSFYNTTDGLLHTSQTQCSEHANAEAFADSNAPPGYKAIEGQFDPLSQRVDTISGEVVNYQPPQPSLDHEWDDTTKRWQLNAAAAQRLAERSNALTQIPTLEAKQHRAMREYALGIAGAAERLSSIENQIAALRAKL